MNIRMHIFDQHAFIGASGTVASLALQNVNTIMSILVATATLVYMITLTVREIRKMKQPE